ncbi:MAG TPA: hypothetical protein VGD99_10015, partial [Anaerolineae bacterium]
VFGYDQMLSQARDIDKLYEGRELQGQVVATLCGGRFVFRDGDVTAPAGSGGFVGPKLNGVS